MVEKLYQPKAAKKIFLIDFTIKGAFTFQRDFIKLFENMLFLELIKKDYKLFYTDYIDLYEPNKKTAFLIMPFTPSEIIKMKLNILQKEFSKLKIEKVHIITLEYEEEFEKDKIEYKIETFWNFATKI